MSGAYYPPSIPRVKGVAQAGQDTVALTLESGEVVTVTARPETCMHPDGVLVTGYRSEGQIYLIPSFHDRWIARMHLGLYNSKPDGEEARFDAYLMKLGSITEVDWTGDVLTLVYLNPQGQRRFAEFTGDVSANFTYNLSDGGFTRHPLRVFIQEGQGEAMKLVGFRVDHTPEGYTALKALGWLAELPALEGVRPADHLNAAD